MATAPVIYCDGFMDYAAAYPGTTDAPEWWTSALYATINSSGGRGGRGYITNLASPTRKETGVTHSCWIMSFAIYGLVTPNEHFYVGTSGAYFQGNDAGQFINPYGGGTTSIATRAGAWTHVSIRVSFSATVGTVDIWMDETLALHQTGLNTGTGGSSFAFVTGIPLSDLVVQASSTATDLPFGDRAVVSLFVNGAGNYTDLTPSAGANYECVDDTAPDEDATYVSSSTATDRDSYALSSLPAAAAAVDAVQVCYVARKTDAGSRSLTPFVRIGGTDYDGSAANLSTSWAGFYEVLDVSPATSSAWSVAEVNGMEAGVLVG